MMTGVGILYSCCVPINGSDFATQVNFFLKGMVREFDDSV